MMSIALVINSCYKFHETTLPRIVESARLAGVPGSRIYAVVGESEADTDIIFNGQYNVVFTRYTNVDYSAAVYFTQSERGRSELSKYTHFFYIHDTCKILPEFWTNLHQYSCQSYIKLQEFYSKTIGFFNTAWFLKNKTDLMKYYANTNRDLYMQYKSGDFPNKAEIYKMFKNLGEILNEDCLFLFDRFIPTGPYFANKTIRQFIENVYGTPRMVSEYSQPGIQKFQKNWGQGGWNVEL